MSTFKVSKEPIDLFIHPNADSLEIGKVGTYQVVVQKGLYKSGDLVVFAPEKSVLTGDLKQEFEKYLVGPNKDRVKSVRLRGELSCGIIVPPSLIPFMEELEVGEDVSEKLGITKYEPPIPSNLAGNVKPFDIPGLSNHDCEHIGVYVNEFNPEERIVVTEKVHGTQLVLVYDFNTDTTLVSSKGLFKSGLVLQKSETNAYWQVVENDKLVEKIKSNFTSGVIQLFGEAIPFQSGYTYGKTKPTCVIFDLRQDGVSIPYDMVPEDFKELWVPVIYDGPIQLEEKEVIIYSDPEKGIHKTRTEYLMSVEMKSLCKGKETVSGQSLHIREGVVFRPYVDRKAFDGTPLKLKLISPEYRETGEEFN